ncbi:hypothetical protein KIN20_020784, partial [Parelaphostrongylus tenuis]
GFENTRERKMWGGRRDKKTTVEKEPSCGHWKAGGGAETKGEKGGRRKKKKERGKEEIVKKTKGEERGERSDLKKKGGREGEGGRGRRVEENRKGAE